MTSYDDGGVSDGIRSVVKPELGMDRRSGQSVGNNKPNSQGQYRSSTTFQLQQPNAGAADGVSGQRMSSRRSVVAPAAASQRGSSTAAAYQQGFGASPPVPPTPAVSLASPVLPSTAADIQRASVTGAAARGTRQSAMLNSTAPPVHRTSMLVQLQQPTADGGSIVQPVRDYI